MKIFFTINLNAEPVGKENVAVKETEWQRTSNN